MTIDDAIDMLKALYQTAQEKPYVQKPIAWALYYTWKAFDMAEPSRKEMKEE